MLTRNLFAVANLVIEMERGYGDIAVVSRGLPASVRMTTISHSTGSAGWVYSTRKYRGSGNSFAVITDSSS